MSSRVDWYFRQRVSEGELDLAFDELEQADWNLASDLGVYGVISGAVAVPHTPVANLSIDLTAPGRSYDRLGRRVFLAAGATVDCSKDLNGTPTDVVAPNAERWLSVYLRFSRLLSDPRTDGNNQTVYFRRDEACEVVLRQGAAAAAGQAQRPALEPDELLVCDVHRTVGQTQIVATDIDASRRQVFVFAPATSVSVVTGGWKALAPTSSNVQASLDSADQILAQHLAGVLRHTAADVNLKAHGFVTASNVQAGVEQIVDLLAAQTAGTPGSSLVGADPIAGVPFSMLAGTVDGQLAGLIGGLNAHATGPGVHNAGQITSPAFQYLTSTTVQAQLQELVTKLAAQAAAQSGAGRIGAEPQSASGAPKSLTAGTVRDQLGQLLTALNAHIGFFDANHFRDDVANAGLHRAIKQPALGSGTVLLWESFGNGTPAGRFRIYSDGTSVWRVVGASWDGAKWQWDAPAAGSMASAYRQAAGFIEFREIQFTNTNSGGFTDWPNVWRLPLDGSTESSGWVAVGSGMRECGRVSIEGLMPNGIFTGAGLQLGTSATFRTRFDQAPSAVTLTMIAAQNWGSTQITVTNIDVDGFAITANVPNPPTNVPVRWVGRYVAVR